jgi:hypothetical protein
MGTILGENLKSMGFLMHRVARHQPPLYHKSEGKVPCDVLKGVKEYLIQDKNLWNILSI